MVDYADVEPRVVGDQRSSVDMFLHNPPCVIETWSIGNMRRSYSMELCARSIEDRILGFDEASMDI